MARGRPPSTKTLVDRQLGRNVVNPILPDGDGYIIPNHSGDHTAGETDTPTDERKIANKKYVDDEQGNHNIADHNDTSATGTELNTLTDDSMADTLHRHSELSASDGTPDAAVAMDALGNMIINNNLAYGSKTAGGTPFVIFRLDGSDVLQMGDTENVVNVDLRAKDNILFSWGGIVLGMILQNTTGNVGINTITPDTKLQVVGDVKFGDDNTNYVTVDTTGNMVFVGGAGLPFAEIYCQNSASTLTIATAGKANKVQVACFDTNGKSNNMTPDHTNDHITVTKAGIYMCNVSMTLDSLAGASGEFGFSIYKNNGATEFGNVHVIRDLAAGAGGNHGSVSMSGIIDLAVNDTIELWGWNNSNTQNVTVDSVTMSLVQVGGT